MQQLSGVDASFLYMETSKAWGHVSGLAVFRRPDVPGWSPYEALRDRLAAYLPQLEPFRRRLVEVPLALDHPYWIEDPDFDLEFHIRDTAVPPPGTDDKLAALTARLIARPLDRSHPLWEAYVIEGLSDNRFAILTKLHHAAIDGAAGAELMALMYQPEGTESPPVPDASLPKAPPVPSQAEVLGRALTDVVRKPTKYARLQVRSVQALGELTRNKGLTGLADLMRTLPNPVGASLGRRRSNGHADGTDGADSAQTPPVAAAPITPFNGAISGNRRVALRSASLEDVKAFKRVAGFTVNDVVMAACSGALRTYLEEKDALPDQPLVAMVPVSIRTGQESDPWTNRVSAIFPPIPTDEADQKVRMQRVHEAMNEAKERFKLMPADVLTQYADFAPPALAIRAASVASRLRVADRVRPPFNLVISNVPGPRRALMLDGARLEHYYPVSTITDGQGLNITLQSYRDILDFSLVADRELVPDVEHLADLLEQEFASLHALL
jgi:diacylglycerol O-acyltransferase